MGALRCLPATGCSTRSRGGRARAGSTRKDVAKCDTYVSDNIYPAVVNLSKGMANLDHKVTALSAPTPMGYLEPQKPAPSPSSPASAQNPAAPAPETRPAPPVVIVDSPGAPGSSTAGQEPPVQK